jgi:hypothetical protein
VKARRLPVLVVFAALIVAGVWAQQRADDEPVEVAQAPLEQLMAVAAPSDASSSTWFCAAGTATGDDEGQAEQTVIVANTSDRDLAVQLTAFSDDGDQAETELAVAARSRNSLTVSELLEAPDVAVLVEAPGGLVAVEHRVEGPHGSAVGPCASSAGTQWYFPSGSTRLGTRLLYAVFNPFPGEAAVDLTFATEEGSRSPVEYQNRPVPGGSVEVIDVTDVVTVRDQVATTVTTRTGRVVVEQLMITDGAEDWPESLSLTSGAPAAMSAWTFAGGVPLAEGVQESYVVFNPGQDVAEVDVEVLVDGTDVSNIVEPFAVSVRPGRAEVVSLTGDGRVPAGVGHQAVVRSVGGQPVVAVRVLSGGGTGDETAPVGTSITLGAPLVASQWIVGVAGLAGSDGGEVAIANPSPTQTAVLTVRTVEDGTAEPLEGYDGVSLAPLSRTLVDVGDLGDGTALAIEADAPLTVERSLRFADPGGFSSSVAVPVAGTVALPPTTSIDASAPTTVLGVPEPTDSVPTETVAPGTDVDAATPGTGPDTATDPGTGPDAGDGTAGGEGGGDTSSTTPPDSAPAGDGAGDGTETTTTTTGG